MSKDNRPDWEGKHYAFFQNRQCEYFPCHATEKPEDFNCLFCYCPLYALGDKCGGGFRYLENGFKDCSACSVPHDRKNYGRILEKYSMIAELASKNREVESHEN